MKANKKAILFFALAALCLFAGIKSGGNALLGGLVMVVLFVLLAFRQMKKSSQHKSKAKDHQLAVESAPAKAQARSVSEHDVPNKQPYRFVNFHVAGTTYKNDDGSDRQVILRHIKFQDAPYVTDPENVDIHIQSYEYNGEPAYKCIVNGYTIGNVPREKIPAVAEAIKHNDAKITGFEIIGGGNKNGERINYGCNIAIRYSAPLQE